MELKINFKTLSYNMIIQTHYQDEFPGYPTYEACDDIYMRCSKQKNVNPEDINSYKYLYRTNIGKVTNKEKLNNDERIENLDVPGADLDDENENMGNEDEENNYYSLGGDNHNDLEEDKSEVN